jgi:hypothetical protein
MDTPDQQSKSPSQLRFEILAGMRGSKADRERVKREIRAELGKRQELNTFSQKIRDWRYYSGVGMWLVLLAVLLWNTGYISYRIGFSRGADLERHRPLPLEEQINELEWKLQNDRLRFASDVHERDYLIYSASNRIQDIQRELDQLRQRSTTHNAALETNR